MRITLLRVSAVLLGLALVGAAVPIVASEATADMKGFNAEVAPHLLDIQQMAANGANNIEAVLSGCKQSCASNPPARERAESSDNPPKHGRW
jgi:hypothetical protein